MRIVFFAFEGLTALDIIGPYEVLSRLPGAQPVFVAQKRGTVRTDAHAAAFGFAIDASIDDVKSADMLVVPGGIATRALERDERVLSWLRAVDATTSLTASVCTGALLLGAAGILRGKRATTHFAARDRLRKHGAIVVDERVVRDGKYATCAGVSAGIDLALTIAIERAGIEVAQAIQLGIEYDPQPPVNAGSDRSAPAHIVDAVLARIRARERALE
ncbi:MAG TPA: DJ-1/PfpI family protein [Myxococcota bacterium]|jgi:putative intracellular protease/amidase